MNNVLEKLYNTIEERKSSNLEDSYVASLINNSPDKIGRKVSEEATEVLVASLIESQEDVINESADLIFHLMVLLAKHNIKYTQVLEVLEERMGISGLDEKAARIAKEKGKLE